jgi:hypothetical protein
LLLSAGCDIINLYQDIKTMKRFILLLLLSLPAYAWNDCPFGLIDDPSPGRCRLYIDSNNDRICDRSQKEPEKKADSTATPAMEVSTNSNAKSGVKEKEPSSYTPNPQLSFIKPSKNSAASSSVVTTTVKPNPLKPPHHAWQIFLAMSLLAAATEILISKKRALAFRLQTAWNWLLLLTFLLSSLTGIFFVLPPSWRPALGLNISYWHTETGLIFIAVGLYHSARRLSCMFRGLEACFSGR